MAKRLNFKFGGRGDCDRPRGKAFRKL